jgi:predicted AlkP superfamily phosphohydrolase/phosphomutase
VALSLKKAVWPIRYVSDLQDINYKIDIDTSRAREDHEYLMDDLGYTLDSRLRVVEHFWKSEDWDFTEVVVTGTDRIQHYIWDALEDPSHALHDGFIGYYRRVDEFIGKLVARFSEVSGRPEGEGLFLLSDHGFCGIKQEVRVNRWLMENGYLKFDGAPGSLDDLSAESKAFALDPGRIYLNWKKRFPKGSVDESSARAIIDEIKVGLSELTYEGEPVIERVFERDEVYSGPVAAQGPDILPVGNHGYDLKGTIREDQVFGRTNLTGMHTWDDAFFWSKDAPEGEVEITQLAGKILEAAG